MMVQRLLGQPHIVLPVAHRPAQAARELVVHSPGLSVLLANMVAQPAALDKAQTALLAGILMLHGNVLSEQVLLVPAKLFATQVAGQLFFRRGFFVVGGMRGGHVGLQRLGRGELVLTAGAGEAVRHLEVIPEIMKIIICTIFFSENQTVFEIIKVELYRLFFFQLTYLYRRNRKPKICNIKFLL